jgi:hypothetical protein
LLVIDPTGRVLLFRFFHQKGALAGQDYWATPAEVSRKERHSKRRRSGSLRKRLGSGLKMLGQR